MLISILSCALGFHAITTKITIFKNEASVELNLLVSLFGRFVVCGGRKHRHADQVL